jgi:acyl carrier protein
MKSDVMGTGPPVSREEIFRKLRDVLTSRFELDPDRIVPGAHLAEDLDLDSIDWIDLAVQLEQDTGHKLAESELTAMRTVQDVVEVLHRKLSGSA